ncbi:ABC transporter ATP-binding protein [Williamsia sterculiae]|uniref:NitT/TauT family transport system ATP-binding protein n=1 Tax=Williamsia sterculiae TaxID=1344003 RepID=A0A1N7CLW3_9NOCA|nr:ABC transporter ATP-binding protein [Williamsia sterculiae]SIR64592.1 NitT/TauT family transport system ATP-binding protein [Williamsia sterculiae]
MSDAQTHAKISLRNVTKSFPDRARGTSLTALDDISIDVAAGEFVTLVGPSGCGKSTLLDLVGGLSTPTSGEVRLDGELITGPGLDRGIVFQQYALFPWRTAQANVEFGLEAKGLRKRDRADRAREVLELVGLAAFANRYPHELSGGMKQRVAIARSLAYEPEVLLMDEPYAALDAQTRELLQVELRSIWERTATTVLFITHGIEEAIFLGQRVLIMTSRPGRVKEALEIDLGEVDLSTDVRSSPEFVRYRSRVWESLHDEVLRANNLTAESLTQGELSGAVSG